MMNDLPIEVTLKGFGALTIDRLSGSDGLSGLDVEVIASDAVDIPLYDSAYEVTSLLDSNSILTVELASVPGSLSGLDVEVIASDAVDIPTYNGVYEVTPSLYLQQFGTKNKKMKRDITVKQIPIVYTSNVHDGKTVVIG